MWAAEVPEKWSILRRTVAAIAAVENESDLVIGRAMDQEDFSGSGRA